MIVTKMTQHVQTVRAWTHYVTVTMDTVDVIAKFQVSFSKFFSLEFPIRIRTFDVLFDHFL